MRQTASVIEGVYLVLLCTSSILDLPAYPQLGCPRPYDLARVTLLRFGSFPQPS
jgi:hypothetical protein